MDALLNAALAGTARGGKTLPTPTTPADALAAQLPDLSAERRLLLMAGARAVYRQAGSSLREGVTAPEPAPAEHLPACSPGAAQLIGAMLEGTQADLLPEALERLRLAGQRVPPTLLPSALAAGTRTKDLRPLLLPVLGERGRWLALHNPEWRWTAQVAPNTSDDSPTLNPVEAETIWQEGSPGERLTVLRQLRRADPARGREWLETVWRGERAEFRVEAIKVLEHGLSLDDEPFLEAALDDRSQSARKVAATLLAQLRGSAFAERMRERAESLVGYSAPTHSVLPLLSLKRLAGALVGRGMDVPGEFTVTLPPTVDEHWQRDGITVKSPQGVGERAWWLVQVLSFVPLRHWLDHFDCTIEVLIQAAVRDGDWGKALLEGWTRATILHRDHDWAEPLWKYWTNHVSDNDVQGRRSRELRFGLITVMKAMQIETLLMQAFGNVAALDSQCELCLALPRPWSVSFAGAYLQAYKQYLGRLVSQPAFSNAGSSFWLWTRSRAALALPSACFAQALEDMSVLPDGKRYIEAQQRDLATFIETIRTRQRLMEEIPL